MVFFELCFVGLLCLATFLFSVFVLTGAADVGVAATLLALAEIALEFIHLLVTHFTLRTVVRRGTKYEAGDIAGSAWFAAIPVVVVADGLFHMLLLQVVPSALGEVGWVFTKSALIYIFALALGWHIVTAWLLKRTPPETA